MFSCSKRLISNTTRTLQRLPQGRKTKVQIKQQIVPIDPWTEVKDKESGLTYWWNQQTNETTHLGATKPTLINELTPPGPAQQQLQTQPQQGGMLSGLGGVMAEGFAFGVGSSIARSAVNAIFDSGSGEGDSGGGGDDIVEL